MNVTVSYSCKSMHKINMRKNDASKDKRTLSSLFLKERFYYLRDRMQVFFLLESHSSYSIQVLLPECKIIPFNPNFTEHIFDKIVFTINVGKECMLLFKINGSTPKTYIGYQYCGKI